MSFERYRQNLKQNSSERKFKKKNRLKIIFNRLQWREKWTSSQSAADVSVSQSTSFIILYMNTAVQTISVLNVVLLSREKLCVFLFTFWISSLMKEHKREKGEKKRKWRIFFISKCEHYTTQTQTHSNNAPSSSLTYISLHSSHSNDAN